MVMLDYPYPTPERIPTKTRCKYSLPGRKYNCRCIGHYFISSKGYCARHYDAMWKYINPVHGTQHDWHVHVNKFTGVADSYETCKRCGSIRVYKGIAQCLCRGHMAIIELR